MYFATSCTMRASPTVLVIVPNAVLWMFACGAPKFGRLKRVEDFAAEHEVLPAERHEPLADGQIDVLVAGRAQDADARIAELAPRRRDERRPIDPAIERRVVDRTVADAIGPLRGARGLERRVRPVGHRDRESGMGRDREAHRPPARDRVERTVRVAAKPPPLAERHLVAAGHREDVPRVVGGRAVVGLDVVAVHRVRALARHARVAEVPELFAFALPRV